MKSQILLFGLPSWILIDITWSMVSQIAKHVPESYSITAYLIFALTIGNLVPLFLNTVIFQYGTKKLHLLISIILFVGFLCGIALSLLWNRPITIGSHQYSIPFCCVFFLIGACSSSSNVTHYMFVSQFTSKETTYLSTGMALGSMTAGLFGLLQGLVLNSLGLNVSYAFLIVSALYIPSMYSFYHLLSQSPSKNDDDESCNTLLQPNKVTSPIRIASFPSFYKENTTLVYVQFLNTSLGYGLIPALISPICSSFRSPYTVILLATGIFCVMDPICRSLTIFWSLSSFSHLSKASSFLYFLALLLLLPLTLPSSALHTSPIGGLYPVLLYVLFGTLFGFINTSVFLYLKHSTTDVSSYSIEQAYRYTGVISQSGALCGSLISFILVISGVVK